MMKGAQLGMGSMEDSVQEGVNEGPSLLIKVCVGV